MTVTDALRPAVVGVRGRPHHLVVEAFAIAAGVAAVVLAAALGHSASVLAARPAYGLDRQLVVVAATAPSLSGVQAGFRSLSLTTDDIQTLGNGGYIPDAVAIAPTTGLVTSVRSGSRVASADVVGSTDAFAKVRGYAVSEGRSFTAAEVVVAAPVAVLGRTVVDTLFAGIDPVGRYVQVANQTFQVVGTFQPRGLSGSYDQDNLVVTPLTTAWKLLLPNQADPIDQVLLRATTPARAKAVASEAATALDRRHNITDPALADFTVRTQPQLVAAGVHTANAYAKLLEAAAAALLLAGALHLASIVRYRLDEAETSGRSIDETALLAEVIISGLVASGAGLVVAFLATPALHRLSAQLPAIRLTVYGVAAGAALGVAAAVMSLLPFALGRRERPSVPPETETQTME